MKRMRFWLSIAALPLAACGGAGAGKGAAEAAEPTVDERVRRGLEAGERGEYLAALTEFQLAQREAPSPLGSLRLACARFLLDNHAQSLAGFRNYLENGAGLSAQERMALAAEIARIEKALDEDRKPEGPSLASQWFKGELARLRADDALAAGAFEEARAGYDAAFGFLGYPEYLFEAAVAATLDGEVQGARERFSEYLKIGGPSLPPDRAFVVAAEVDRLAAILRGEPPITEDSLAVRILAERAGTEKPEAPPPSAVEGEAAVESAAPYRQVEAGPEQSVRPLPRAEPEPVSLEDLLFYARSRSSTVRHRAVRELARVPGDRARRALEERALEDGNRHVRFAAIAGLVARRSSASLPVLRRALVTAATSEERGALKRAIAELQQ